MSPRHARRPGPPLPDGRAQHLGWLALVDVSGPFLSMPVLLRTWPTLDALDQASRDGLRREHRIWQQDPAAGQSGWIDFVLRDLLGWGDALHDTDLADVFDLTVAEHDVVVTPSFALAVPGSDPKPDTTGLLGMVLPPEQQPTARVSGAAWSATPADRLALLLRARDIPLGLATDGRWWALVWAPPGGVTTTAVFDAISWPDTSDRHVVRAVLSLLHRRRFFAVPDDETLPALLEASKSSQEEITEALGVRVRQAVELLVDAFARADLREQETGGPGLSAVPAHEVYRAAVGVLMRIVFLLFAEERGLLPADNELYARAYSVGGLADELERRVREASEDELEQSVGAWHQLLALFTAVYAGVRHPALTLPAYGGSIFDPAQHGWLADAGAGRPISVDDRTVLRMLQAVQYVEVGTGRSRERRRVSFRSLDVEQIGYVYEGLLSYDGLRAAETIVGLVGKPGLEEEVSLRELERLAAQHVDPQGLATALAETYKDSGIGSPGAVAKRLGPLDEADRLDAQRRLLAATENDRDLAERLLPFSGLLRQDLRDLPVVIRAGSLYVTESTLRRSTGTHYTPRFLAEKVAGDALAPLTAGRSSAELLELTVADIAMGSGAFLVAACRYLADRLLEAWAREGDARASRPASQRATTPVDSETDPVVVRARRLVIEHCLYGVDINEMAVEMAKLSMWLVSMDPDQPFTFVDDKLVTGDSLLGLVRLDELTELHPVVGVSALVADIAAVRRALVDTSDQEEKERLLAEARSKATKASLVADLYVGAKLASVKAGARGLREAKAQAADAVALIDRDEAAAQEQARRWLATDAPDRGFARTPLHWPLVFPEVAEAGGFDAVVGNPPFLGGKKISGALGSTYREYLVEVLGRGVKGNADLIAFFVLRAHHLLNERGCTGMLATNTLAQGDSREVGLDQLVRGGVQIRQAVKSAPWPSRSAVLEFSAIWTSRAPVDGPCRLLEPDRAVEGWRTSLPWVVREVRGISPSLDPTSRVDWQPKRLSRNRGIAFIGSYVLGMGFTMEPDQAEALIAKDPRNRDVLFPYLNGEDLNSRPDCSASRWVINFFDWTREQAKEYPEPFDIVEQTVRPGRQRRRPDGNYQLRRPLPQRYWHYADKRPALYRSIEGLDRVLVITLVSKVVIPVAVPTGQVFSHALGVFASDDLAMLALLSSAPHYWWAIERASTLETRIRYTPTDVFETFPRPPHTTEMRQLGERLDAYRRDLMLARQAGLTATYNLLHDPDCTDSDIVELRAIHRAIDEAVVRAYGWTDLLEQPGGLGHDFWDTRQGVRYTVELSVRQEMLDRLTELNRDRWQAEQASLPGAGQEGMFDE